MIHQQVEFKTLLHHIISLSKDVEYTLSFRTLLEGETDDSDTSIILFKFFRVHTRFYN